jgi:hypothetical protein
MLWPFIQNTDISSHSAALFGLLYPKHEQTKIFKMSTTVHKPTKCTITHGYSKGFPTTPTRECYSVASQLLNQPSFYPWHYEQNQPLTFQQLLVNLPCLTLKLCILVTAKQPTTSCFNNVSSNSCSSTNHVLPETAGQSVKLPQTTCISITAGQLNMPCC